MNEPSTKTTFENRIGKSNIDLTLVTNNLKRKITDWKISVVESNSDHSIISYDIKTDINHKNNTKTTVQTYGEGGKYGKVPTKCRKGSGDYDPETK
jgi:hypothetical protein